MNDKKQTVVYGTRFCRFDREISPEGVIASGNRFFILEPLNNVSKKSEKMKGEIEGDASRKND